MQFSDSKPTIFISCSHADAGWKDRLLKHLVPLEREGLAQVRHDGTPGPGDAWYDRIAAGMDDGSTAILLLTPDFLASERITREELPRLLALASERGVRIVPVLVSSCGWQDVPALSRLQMFPAHLTPVSRVEDPDAELAALASEVRGFVRRRPAAASAPAARGFVPPDPDKVFVAGLPRTGSLLLGRDPQIRALDQAWNEGVSNVACLTAWGGVGKSALINGWLNRMAQDHFRGARRVYAWSFDRQGLRQRASSSDEFFAAAFRWFWGGGEPMPLDPLERASRLAARIRAERTLLVLDGVEPLQHPSGADEGQIRDVALSTLLRDLAGYNEGGLCLLSSRLPVRDLEEFGDRVVQLPLERLSVDAGAELLRARGVRGADDELRGAVEEYQGHALALNLLAGYLADVHEGDVTRRSEVPPTDLVGEGAERVLRAYDEWYAGKPAGAALRLLGFFDRPASAGALKALTRGPAIPGLTEALQGVSPAEWARTVATLRRASLVARANEDAPGQLDTHPLVRAYYERQVSVHVPDAWREANSRLYEHYRDEARPLPATLDEMQPLLLALVHGCRAGRHRDALYEVLLPRVLRGEQAYILSELAAYGALLTSVAGFCEGGDWSRPVPPSDGVQGLGDEEQLLLLPIIAYSLLTTRGYASQEMQACSDRVREVALRLGRTEYMQSIAVTRWRFTLVTRPLPETMKVARELEAYASTDQPLAMVSAAHSVVGTTHYFMGDLRRAGEHTEAGIRAWHAGAVPLPTTEYHMALIGNLIFSAKVLWHQGVPREARARTTQAVRIGRDDLERTCLPVALYGASFLNQFCRDAEGTLATATELADISGAQGNRLYQALGVALKGWAIVRAGNPAEGAALIQQALARYRDMGTGLVSEYLCTLLAEAQIAMNQLDAAAVSLQRGARLAEQFDEVWWSAETMRLMGVVQCGRGEVDGACATFRAAMERARSYGSRALEARAGVSLVRLLREQGRDDEAAAVRLSIAAGPAPALTA
jgi:tetratricopeptide (TPR) repeat protein